ncbi:MAG: M48 family metallopeptidase [Candidatus Omnitrophica bacterium]|nr:M48 family metallopeptidase [Candidatus Omnitrophota bacterium]
MAHARFFDTKIILFISLLSLAGCATVNVANVGEKGYKLADDEQRLIKRVEEFSEILDGSDYIYHNQALEDYLRQMASQLLPARARESGISINVKMLKDPEFNAFSFSNGKIYIHSGIIAACENEAQLAALLGHEIGHVVNRHALKEFRATINKSAFMSAMSGLGLAGAIMQIGTMSSAAGYSQHLEFEADELGFTMMKDNGYDVHESKILFQSLEKHLAEEEIKTPFFFSSHPQVKSRISSFQHLIDQTGMLPATRIQNNQIFYNLTKDIRKINIELCLMRGYFKTAERFLNQYINLFPNEGNGYFLKGELFRQRTDITQGRKERAKSDDWNTAISLYEHALNLDPSLTKIYKFEGYIYEKTKQMPKARDVFTKYLEHNPQAEDRAYIQHYLDGKEKL